MRAEALNWGASSVDPSALYNLQRRSAPLPIHPDAIRLDEMSARPSDEPVVMLNLLRFREQAQPGFGVDAMSGSEAFLEYGRRFDELHPRFGGRPIWVGKPLGVIIGAEDEAWDLALLVRYPSREKFVSMLADPDYLEIAPIRAAALVDSRLIEMSQLMMLSSDEQS